VSDDSKTVRLALFSGSLVAAFLIVFDFGQLRSRIRSVDDLVSPNLASILTWDSLGALTVAMALSWITAMVLEV